MKKFSKLLVILLVLCTCFALFAACDNNKTDSCAKGHKWGDDNYCTVCHQFKCDVIGHSWVNGVCSVCKEVYELTDYVGNLKIDMGSASAKYYAGSSILKGYVDGDTTHFYVPTNVSPDGVLKARYLAVNTPESTGRVEAYGKLASTFTETTLQSALDKGGNILIESDSDDGKWNHDTYDRYLVWIWYQPESGADYRNLNLELLQKGYGFGSNAAQNRYGEVCAAALGQALNAKLIVHSGEKDPDFHYGDAYEVTLKQIRTNLSFYENAKVSFKGVVTSIDGDGCYVEDYDTSSGLVYGIYVYYGTQANGRVKSIYGTPGNYVQVVGVLTSKFGWQVSDVKYQSSKPDHPDNSQLLDTGRSPYYTPITVEQFLSKTTVTYYDEQLGENVEDEFDTRALILNATVSLSNLTVVSTYTTSNGGSNDGAFTLTCEDSAGRQISIRTIVLYNNGQLVLASEFPKGTVINVRGIVDYYSDQDLYQVKVLRYSDITIVE